MSVRFLLECDLISAGRRRERARKALARAERAVELRTAELSAFERDGTVPRRKRVVDRVNDATIQRARAQGIVVGKRGQA